MSEPLAGLFHRLTPGAFNSFATIENSGPLDLLRVQGVEKTMQNEECRKEKTEAGCQMTDVGRRAPDL